MLARCARCHGTFTTDRFGLQTCPHCGSELLLSDPNAPAGAAPPEAPPPAPAPPPASPGAAPPEEAGGLPPPPPSPPGGYGPPPPGGWGPPPGGGWGGYPPPGGPPGLEAPAPFAERARRGFFAAFFETWKLVATQPAVFFRRVRIDQTGAAVLFGVIASTAGNLVAAIYAYLSGTQAQVAMREMIESMPEEQARILRVYLDSSGGLSAAQVIASPLLTLVFIYVGAGILHLLLMLFRGANRGFDATLTVVAYTSGLNLLLAVPVCGSLLALVWGLVALVIGLGEIQRCGSGKAAAAVLAPAALLCVCCCAAVGLSGPALLKILQEAANQTQQTRI